MLGKVMASFTKNKKKRNGNENRVETLSVGERRESKDCSGKRCVNERLRSGRLFCKAQYLLDGVIVKLLLIPLFPVHRPTWNGKPQLASIGKTLSVPRRQCLIICSHRSRSALTNPSNFDNLTGGCVKLGLINGDYISKKPQNMAEKHICTETWFLYPEEIFFPPDNK